MMTLNGRQDGFRIKLPDDFIVDEIKEKYTSIIKRQKSFITKPIDFLNETIQSVQVLGFVNASMQQQQSANGKPLINQSRAEQNRFPHTATEYSYRSQKNPIALVDKTLNIYFRHTLGFVNYFLMFENFFYLYSRDTKSDKLISNFNIDILNDIGEVYSRIVIMDPIINGIDMLDLSYQNPIANMQNFKVEFKYSNLDYQFIQIDNE